MRIFKYLFFLALFFIAVLGGFIYYSYNYFTAPYVKEDTFFIVNKGSSFRQIVDDLSEDNLINPKTKNLFLYLPKLLYRNGINVKAGEYMFAKDTTPFQILKKLKNGNVFFRKLTFAEGLSNDSILKIIDSAPGLAGDLPSEEIAEGTLLPETYLYTYGDSKKEIVHRMQKAMIDYFNEEWDKRATDLPFKTKKEALSLASIVEKETGVPEERGLVASVFVNRLRKGMRLQSDPTVVYAFTKGNKDLEREIRKSDLARVSEYNTYIIKGIPENPIANPGKDSIKAVLNPQKTDYLFFVATGNGGHNFSKTLKEHNEFVRKYRKAVNN